MRLRSTPATATTNALKTFSYLPRKVSEVELRRPNGKRCPKSSRYHPNLPESLRNTQISKREVRNQGCDRDVQVDSAKERGSQFLISKCSVHLILTSYLIHGFASHLRRHVGRGSADGSLPETQPGDPTGNLGGYSEVSNPHVDIRARLEEDVSRLQIPAVKRNTVLVLPTPAENPLLLLLLLTAHRTEGNIRHTACIRRQHSHQEARCP